MDLEALAKSCPDITVSISLRDLLASQEALVKRVREEERRAIEQQSEDVDDLIPKDIIKQKLGVNPSTLWRWEKEGYLMAVRIGTKIFYRTSRINEILNSKQVR